MVHGKRHSGEIRTRSRNSPAPRARRAGSPEPQVLPHLYLFRRVHLERTSGRRLEPFYDVDENNKVLRPTAAGLAGRWSW